MITTCESPANTGNIGRALVRVRTGSGLDGGRLSVENPFLKELAERCSAFPVRVHGGITGKIKCENDFHQEVTGRQPLPVPEVRRVRVRHAYLTRERLIGHSHVPKYGARLTGRQRVGA